MDIFLIALIAAAVLLLAAVPGYLLIKTKTVSEECISGFSKLLLFVCQPCLAVYSFSTIDFSLKKLGEIGIFALLCLAIDIIMLGASYLILRKKCKEAIYRIITIATTFSNCAFFGIPIIEAIMGEAASEVLVYTTVFAVIMNIVGWTLGSAIIAQDIKYMSVKKIFLNPATIGAIVALFIFILKIQFPSELSSLITQTARMSTPLSMIIMGMRLATMKFPSLFKDMRVYAAIAIKQLIMPLVAFALVYFLPISPEIKQAFFIICACPVASVVLNFAEIVGEGRKEAASCVLLGTAFSVLTLPITMLLLPLL